jgi:hypothetical protein
VTDLDKHQFLCGDWMTAFTYHVMKDHLTRNAIAHEIFAKVHYTAPVDVIASSSDFDVIALVGRIALCLECKSGTINRTTANDITSKANGISMVLRQFVPNIAEFRFFLVFDDATNDAADVAAYLQGTGVEPKRIDEIRALVFDLFRDQYVAEG